MSLKINQKLVNIETAQTLVNLCPFSAISYDGNKLEINAACKSCKMCVKKGPVGVISWEEEKEETINKNEYKGICVYADVVLGKTHNVTFELIGEAKTLAEKINHPVYVVIIGYKLEENVNEILKYGVDKVFVYDDERLQNFDVETYSNCFQNFIENNKPTAILVGATNIGRSLAPRLAARFHTGLTADCTKLQIKENTDLVQIRPAFGGNIMAQIINSNHRPQFATVRYKVFDAPIKNKEVKGKVERVDIKQEWLKTNTEIISVVEKIKELDISESEVLIAVGRGLKNKDDLVMIEKLAKLLGGNVACSRPLVEAGIFDSKHQIGLSGKTVKPKLIITLGISGAIQFVSGMKSSETIIAINKDENAPIFDIANYGIVGDMYDIVPKLIKEIEGGK